MPKRLKPRQLAGRKNRALRGEISPAGRAALREAIAQTRPWLRATGPRTAKGKLRARRNGLRHGERAMALAPSAIMDATDLLRAGFDGADPSVVLPHVTALAQLGTRRALNLAARLVILHSRASRMASFEVERP